MLELCIFAILRYIYDILKKQQIWNSNFHTSIYRFIGFPEPKLTTLLTLQLMRTEGTKSSISPIQNVSVREFPVRKSRTEVWDFWKSNFWKTLDMSKTFIWWSFSDHVLGTRLRFFSTLFIFIYFSFFFFCKFCTCWIFKIPDFEVSLFMIFFLMEFFFGLRPSI